MSTKGAAMAAESRSSFPEPPVAIRASIARWWRLQADNTSPRQLRALPWKEKSSANQRVEE
jgi:hypothetical protein